MTCSRLYLPLLFISKAHCLKVHGVGVTKSILVTHAQSRSKRKVQKNLSARPKKLTKRRQRTTQTITKVVALHATTKIMAIATLFPLHSDAILNYVKM